MIMFAGHDWRNKKLQSNNMMLLETTIENNIPEERTPSCMEVMQYVDESVLDAVLTDS